MDTIIRAFAIYTFLLLVFRIAGKRSIAQLTTFDFVLLLVIGESTQQALIGDNFSIVNAFILIATLVSIEIGLSKLKSFWPRIDKILDDTPLVVLHEGRFLHERMKEAGVDESDILAAARMTRGVDRAEAIKYAIVEQSGEISIIERKS